jgi:hypothetical protein
MHLHTDCSRKLHLGCEKSWFWSRTEVLGCESLNDGGAQWPLPASGPLTPPGTLGPPIYLRIPCARGSPRGREAGCHGQRLCWSADHPQGLGHCLAGAPATETEADAAR